MQQIRWLQGRMGEVVPVLEQLVAQDPERPTWHAALAWASAEIGDVDGTTREVSALARRGLGAIPRNFEWLATVAGIAIAITRIGDAALAAELYAILEPFATHNCAAGQSAFYGAVAHHLGALAATMGHDDAARAHFDAALTRHRAFGSPPLVALTEDALAALG
jgi:hypothetical protein